MIRTIHLIVAIVLLTAVATTPAEAGWKFQDFMNPQGDRGVGIILAPSNGSGIALAFGCDGTRWRQVALIPQPPDALRLASDGKVSIGFKRDQFTPDGKWKVRAAGDNRAYFAPAPSALMGRLHNAEDGNPAAVLYLKVRPAKKGPITLEFPLAGLHEALAEHLWKPCKLDLYFGDPD